MFVVLEVNSIEDKKHTKDCIPMCWFNALKATHVNMDPCISQVFDTCDKLSEYKERISTFPLHKL